MSRFRAQYERDGFYLSQHPILPLDVVQQALAGMDAVRNGQYDTGYSPAEPSWKPGDSDDGLCRISMPQIASRAVLNLIRHPALGKFVAEVTGSECVQVWWVVFFRKPPSSAQTVTTSIGVHQDFAYWSDIWSKNEGLFTAWIALSDVTETSGPVHFLRGSHKWQLGVRSYFFEQDLDAQLRAVTEAHKDTWEDILGILPPGGVSIHDSLTYHWSETNISQLPRLSFAIHMCSEKSKIKAYKAKTRYINQHEICPIIYNSFMHREPQKTLQ